MLESQPVLQARVGDGDGRPTICHFMSPRDEGEIRWQELLEILRNLLTITCHVLQWLVIGDKWLLK